jgi:lipid A 3-O-deacylase
MTKRLLASALFALFWSPDTWAAGPRTGWLEGVSLSWENDSFVPEDDTGQIGGEDAQYTNGIRLAWEWNPERRPVPQLFARWLGAWCRLGSCDEGDVEHRFGGALGHKMFTPQRITIARPNPRDRPYAAHLYLSTITATAYHRPNGRLAEHLFDLQIGLVGPSARGEELQTWWHERPFVDGPRPRGWGNQLRDEGTLNLDYRWRERFGGENADLAPSLGFGVGTVTTYASAGLAGRLGWHLEPFAPLGLPPAGSGDSWQAYLVASAEARLVAHDLFIAGSLFRDGPQIDIKQEPLVYDLKLGVVLACHQLRAEATWTRRSEEFDSPARGVVEAQEFLTLGVVWRR